MSAARALLMMLSIVCLMRMRSPIRRTSPGKLSAKRTVLPFFAVWGTRALIVIQVLFHAAAVWPLYALVAVMLGVQHRMAHRVDFAFFHVNAALGFVVFALVWVGLA